MYVFFNSRQHVEENTKSFSPSANKPELVVKSWQKLGMPLKIMDVKPLTAEEISLAHDPDYVNGVLAGDIPNGFGSTSKNIAESLRWTNGSFVSTSIYSLLNKVNTFSPTSGFHHAHYANALGYCTFCGLTIAGIILHKNYKAKKIGIIDFDTHHGNGTKDTIEKTESFFIKQYSLGYRTLSRQNKKRWLKRLDSIIKQNFSDTDIVFYQAGMDSHENDPLVTNGYFNDEEIYKRDKIVFQSCKDMSVPVVSNLAGGYQKPIQKIIDLHDLTAKAFYSVFA